MSAWEQRVERLPYLGIGISCEFGSARAGIDALELQKSHPAWVQFLEVGADVARGLDDHMVRWAASGKPATYHFLDVNLADRRDTDSAWLDATLSMARQVGAAWLCGDGGLWHFGKRDRAHMTLLPPVLSKDSAHEMADTIADLQLRTGMAVLPENPPGTLFVGDLHILDYFALVAERAECGLLLDAAHLLMYQRQKGFAPTAGLDGFPHERIVEMHVAGGAERVTDGFHWIEDTHVAAPLDGCWEIFDFVHPRAKNLRAVVYECEKNNVTDVLPGFERLERALKGASGHPRAARR